jgi:hypothetical protein
MTAQIIPFPVAPAGPPTNPVTQHDQPPRGRNLADELFHEFLLNRGIGREPDQSA